MTSRDFCYWLQGYFELDNNGNTEAISLTEKQMKVIKAHLALVFKHEIDPSMGDPAHQQALNVIHDSNPIIRC